MAITRAELKNRLLVPSILSADFSRLGDEVERVLNAGALLIHVDVMDGHFVPNITAGSPLVDAIASRVHQRGGALDVHLMIEDPDKYLEAFAQAGANAISVHVETCVNLHRTLSRIRELGLAAGVAINPATDLSSLGEALLFVDYVLLMSVNPGFGGQQFIPESLDKLRRLRAMAPPGIAIEVDGGLGVDNIQLVAEAGANWVVAGSAVFGAEDPARQVGLLQRLLDEASEPRSRV